MAKETKKAAPAAEKKVVETTVENIVDQIKAGNKFDEAILNEAEEQIKKEADEKKVNMLKDRICKADYVNKRELLELRKRRAEEKVTKTALSETKDALDKLKSGEITPTEYDKVLKEIDNKKFNGFREVEKEHNTNVQELRNGYSDYYSYDWEYERRRCW